MSLKARLTGLEIKVGWLKGPNAVLREAELRLRLMLKKKEIATKLMANPEAAAFFAEAGILSFNPHKKPPAPPPPVVVAPPPPPPPPVIVARPPPVVVAWPPPVIVAPPVPVVEAPPPPVLVNYDPPEHMQIRPVTWRVRGPDDVDDWDDDDTGSGMCICDYDPLEDA